MGKTKENLDKLSLLLENSKESGVSIDDAPEEITAKRGRPKKKKVEYYTWCGMQVPDEIYDICNYIKETIVEQKKYVPALDIQIYNVAVQQWVYNDLITKKITGREIVPTRALTTSSESLRRALQSCGLTVTDKKSGIKAEDAEVNPLEELMDAMNSEDDYEEEVVSKKPKKKK